METSSSRNPVTGRLSHVALGVVLALALLAATAFAWALSRARGT